MSEITNPKLAIVARRKAEIAALENNEPIMNTRESLAHLKTLNTIAEIETFIEKEVRKTVLDAATKKINQLKTT